MEELRLRRVRGEDIEHVPKRKRELVASLQAAKRRVPEIPSALSTADAIPPEDLVGRKCMVLWTGDEDDSSAEEASMYPALVVRHIKQSKDVSITHLIHFDDGMSERVGIPDTGIEFADGPRMER